MKNVLNTNTIYVLSIAFLIWGVFGLKDIKNQTFDGFDTNQFEVIRIEEAGPADQAGMKIGDILVSSDGISIKDYKELDKRPRAIIGQSRTYLIERAGEEQTIELTYTALPQKNKTNRYIQFIIALLFIVLPSVVTSKSNSDLKLSLGLSMTTFGFLFLDGPYFENGPFKDFVDIIGIAIITFALTYLADYLLKYAPQSSITQKKAYRLMFSPMVFIVAVVLIITVIKPDYSSALNTGVQALFTLFFLGYLGISIVTLIRKFLRTEAAKRKEYGLDLMLLGVCFSLLPLFILFTINTINPGAEIPGDDYVFMGFALIPITFSLALNRYEQAG